jgi:MFS superfamily sulfate permease-like transporter
MLYRIALLMQHLRDANIYTVCIGFGLLAVVAGSEVMSARIPGALIGLIVATLAVVWGELERSGVHVIGSVPGTLPVPSFPDISAERWVRLLPLSFLIALIVMVQTAATTRSFPSDADRPPHVDRDFFGVGAGGILSGLFGAFPVNASPPRTGIVAETGGRTQLSGLFAAAIVLALLAFGTTLLRNVPHAALSGVLLFVALRIVRTKQIVTVYHQSFGEFLLIAATAAAIIVMPIEQGVSVGVALSLLSGIWSTTRARLVEFEHVPAYHPNPPFTNRRRATISRVVVCVWPIREAQMTAEPHRDHFGPARARTAASTLIKMCSLDSAS